MISLSDSFTSYVLTEEQKSLVEKLSCFLNDDSSCFILSGYAGTGKTFMMKGLTKFLSDNKRSFRLAAPTGRAAKVLSKRTGQKAYTIHKTIYSNKDLKEYKVQDEEGTESFKFYYDLRQNEDPKGTIFIVDEASMVSDAYSEGEFFRFGSGFLLQDFLRYVNVQFSGSKVIFLGDIAQLPPVNMNFSPALDSNYLLEKCAIEAVGFGLTTVVRQNSESGILGNATGLRQAIETKVFNSVDICSTRRDVSEIIYEDFLEEYVKACGHQINENVAVVAYSNASVKVYNDLIRRHFFQNTATIVATDRVVLVHNNYNHGVELLNGDFGVVKEVANVSEERKTILKRKGSDGNTLEYPVIIKYRDVKVEFRDNEDRPQLIECKIIENLLSSEKRDISSDEQNAIYIDFWVRNPKLNQIKQLLYAKSTNYDKLQELITGLSPADLNAKSVARVKQLQEEYFKNASNNKLQEVSVFILKDALRADPYFNALRLKFGYAFTCHKAQGGEWDQVFLDCKTSMGYFNASYFRWLYTGLTRAKKYLFTLNAPHYGIGTNLQPQRSRM